MTLTEDTVLTFLKDTLNVEEALEAETGLFSTGMLDSVAMLSLIAFVEETAGIDVRPADVTLDNFDTAGRIVRYADSQR